MCVCMLNNRNLQQSEILLEKELSCLHVSDVIVLKLTEIKNCGEGTSLCFTDYIYFDLT